MRLIRNTIWLGILTAIVITVSSCKREKTYADYVKSQTVHINRLLSDSGFVVIDTYPANGVFARNEFYHDSSTGVYYNVVDSGNGTRVTNVINVVKGDTVHIANPNVFFRYSETQILPDTTKYSINVPGVQAIQFTYNASSTYTSTSTPAAYNFMSPGVVVPLDHVGENAVVRIIVPFQSGSESQSKTSFVPIFYGYLRYTLIQ